MDKDYLDKVTEANAQIASEVKTAQASSVKVINTETKKAGVFSASKE